MSSHIQIRNVPDEVHRRLKARAAMEGRSLSDFLLRHLEQVARSKSNQEIFEELARLPPADIAPGDIPTLIREDRSR